MVRTLTFSLPSLNTPICLFLFLLIYIYIYIYIESADSARAEDAEADASVDDAAEAEDAGMDEEDEDFSEYSVDDSADDEEDAETATDVLTSSVFLGHTVASIPAGSEISALVGFHNVGNRPYIVKSVQGSIRDAADFSFVLQNFTSLTVGTRVTLMTHPLLSLPLRF